MTSVDQNDRLEVLGVGSQEVYNLEIANAETLETGFGTIIGVVMCPEETQSSSRAWGYSISGSQVTFTVDSEKTYTVVVYGRK